MQEFYYLYFYLNLDIYIIISVLETFKRLTLENNHLSMINFEADLNECNFLPIDTDLLLNQS